MYKILSFNLEFGGYYLYQKYKSFSYINEYINLIKKYDVDIICFQEAYFAKSKNPHDVSEIIAKKLGYYHKNNPHAYISIISKYPLTKISNNKYNFLTCSVQNNNKEMIITNVHLNDSPNPYYSLIGLPYPETPENITIKEAAILSYKTRENDIETMLSLLKYKKCPMVICGDFNELSHLDGKFYKEDVEWKISKKIYSKNFIDVVRYFNNTDPYYSCDILRKESLINPSMRIDMIYTKNATPIRFKYLKKYNGKELHLSDHIPILLFVNS